VSDKSCCGNRGRACQAAGYGDREIATRDLSNVLSNREMLDLILRQTDAKFAVENSYRGRYRAGFSDDLLQAVCRFKILRMRKAVRDHRRFQRDD
jgi:hypothetical protein